MARGRHSNLRDCAATKTKLNISVSPSTFRNLEQIAKQLKLSKSDLIEKIAKGEIDIASVDNRENLSLKNNFPVAITEREPPTIEQTELGDRSISNNVISQEAYEQQQRQLTFYQTQIERLNREIHQQQAKLLLQDNQSQSFQQELSTKEQQIDELEEQLKQIKQAETNQNNWLGNLLLIFLLIVLAVLLIRFYYFGTIILN